MREPDETVATGNGEREHCAPAPPASHQTQNFYGDDDAEAVEGPDGSLLEDLKALIDDGRTYAQAEMAFQKTRASFAGGQIKYVVAYGAAAFGALHLALIAIAVGLVIALAPIVGPWIATAIVAVVLVIIGVLFLRALKSKVGEIRGAFSGKDT